MNTDVNLWYLIAHPGSASIAVASPVLLILAAGAGLLFYAAREALFKRSQRIGADP